MLTAVVLAAVMQSTPAQDEADKALPPAQPEASKGPKIEWRRRPSDAAMWDSIPLRALQFGVAGKAAIHCQLGLRGELFDCTVISESPPGWGFGEAALKLAPGFLMTAGVPDVKGHRPAVNVPVIWGKPNAHPTLGGSDFGFLAHPHWVEAPTFAEVAAAYPKDGGGAAGYVSLTCDVIRFNGRLGRCLVRMEDPPGHGFAKAALDLTGKFQVDVPEKERKQALGIWTGLQIQFPLAADGASTRQVEGPTLMTDLDPGLVGRLFPGAAKDKGVTTGKGSAVCEAGADGALQNCHASGDGDPPALGFSDAAARVARTLRISPWTDAGQPTDGARVRLSFRFTCAAQ